MPTPLRMPRLLAAAAAVSALALAGCGGSDAFDSSSGGTSPSGAASGSASTGAAGGGRVVVGSAGFTEIQLLAEMYSDLLDKAGYTTEIRVVENREVYEPALESGEMDVVPDYAATMTEFLNRKENGADATPVATNDATETAQAMRELAEPLGLKVLDPAQAVNQNAFVVTQDYATANNLRTLSDLGASGKSVVLAATEECPERPFCQPGLEKTYGIKISKVEPLGFGTVQTKEAVRTGKAQLGLTGTTDGTLGDLGLVALEDDKNLQLADNLVPIVGKEYAGDAKLAETLNELSGVLTTEDLATLNQRVDSERQRAADVANDYLESKGLL